MTVGHAMSEITSLEFTNEMKKKTSRIVGHFQIQVCCRSAHNFFNHPQVK